MQRSLLIVRALARQRIVQTAGRAQTLRALSSNSSNILSSSRVKSEKRYSHPHKFSQYGFQYALVRSYSGDSLPQHFKILLPALSPTMERGTVVAWTKSEGDQLSEGDLLAEIETDKATMGFETPEEGFLAKILVPAGSKDVPLGELLCIIVEEAGDISAFANFDPATAQEAPAAPSSSTSAPQTTPAPAPSGKTFPDHQAVKLPNLSPTMTVGKVVVWSKAEGDELSEGDVIAQIQTDKAVMDMETPDEGYLAKILVSADGGEVPVGSVICVIVANQDDITAFKDYTAADAGGGAPDTPAPAAPSPSAPAAKPAPAAPAPTMSAPTPAAAPRAPGERIFASPYAKKLAAEKGIDLSLLRGSGPDGVIKAQDVESYVPGAAPPVSGVVSAPRTAPPAGVEYVDIPLTSMRQVIAQRLLQSKTTIPHYYLTVDIEVDEVLRLRKELNTMLASDNIKLSVNDFVIKAASLSCIKVPEANSSWQDSFIRQYNTVDMSIAVATENGLITPIVFNADRKGLATISQDIQGLALRAREGKLQPHEFQGGTFTISNLGMFGIKSFSAIINPPQACILAVGGASTVPVYDENSEKGYRAAQVMSVSLSCDHRVVDGAVGAQWLAEFKKFLEKPHTMML